MGHRKFEKVTDKWHRSCQNVNSICAFIFRNRKCFTDLQLVQKRKENLVDEKEFVKIVTRDGVRNLLVPSKRPNTYNEFWPQRELLRLQNRAKVLTVEDKMQKLHERLDENRKMKEECELRKQRLRDIDMAKVTKMEEELDSHHVAENENKHKLLDRAFLAKQERVIFTFFK